MKTRDFDYRVPPSLIAQNPIEPRDRSRLLVMNRAGAIQGHHSFYELPKFLKAGDVLVFNDTRVFPARLFGSREGTGGRVELLLLHQVASQVWEV